MAVAEGASTNAVSRSRTNAGARLLLVLAVAGIALLALSSSARGAEIHPYTGVSFGPDGVGGTESFSRIQAVTVDDSDNVYVFDSQREKIYKFDSSGQPANFSATSTNSISAGFQTGWEAELAVAPPGAPAGTAGDIYLTYGTNEVVTFAPSGTKLGSITFDEGERLTGVATDPNGNVYVGFAVYPDKIEKLVPTANPPKKSDLVATGTFLEAGVRNISVDGVGHLYAIFSGGNHLAGPGVYQLDGVEDPSPTLVDQNSAGNFATALAIEPDANRLFVDRAESSGFVEYGPDAAPIGDLSARGELDTGYVASEGIGVNSDGSKVYGSSTTKLKVFGPLTLAPDVEILPTDGITRNEASFHGTINAAGGPSATCEFQYVTAQQFTSEAFTNPQTAPCEPAGPFSGTTSEAVNASVNVLHGSTQYLVRLVGISTNGGNSTPIIRFTTPEALSVSPAPATEITGSSAQVNATLNPEGIAVSECVFEYGMGFSFDHTMACAESSSAIGTGTDPVPVHATVTGLELGTIYRYRLRAANSVGAVTSGSAEFLTRGPLVGSPGVVASDTTAKFSGKLNPNLDSTTYRFEYLTKAQFEASGFENAAEAPSGGASAGSGSLEVEVAAEANGLQPNTDYVVRLAATNLSGSSASPPVGFHTYAAPTSGLPDDRAYEQVTPATALEKNAVNTNGDKRNASYATPSGDAATYNSTQGAVDTASANLFPMYIARRGADSWSSYGFNPPAFTGDIDSSLGFTEDLTGGYTVDFTPGVTGGIYLYEFETEKLTAISTAPGLRTHNAYSTYLVAESAGGAVVIFEANAKLTADATEGKPNVYAWSKATGEVQLVSILPNGTAAESASVYPPNGYTQSSLSRDGSKAFFTAEGARQLYMRQDPTNPSGTTTLISKSQKTNGTGPGGTDPKGPKPANFLEATPDGRFVFFMSKEALTNDANTGNFDEGQDLYRYDTKSGELIDIAPEAEGAGSETFGLIGTSADGSYAYFVAAAALAPGALPYEPNVYLWHQGEPLQYVTTLIYGSPDEENFALRPGDGGANQKAARVTADGKTLLFSSSFQAGLAEAYKSAIFRWRVGGDGVECVSCNPTGLQQSFYASLRETPQPISTPPSRAITSRNLSADGERVIFSTPESLVPNDVNGAEDVYEWEANGKGSCRSESQNGGCIYLISTGTSPEDSYISDISENGDNVFFFTSQRLVGQDKDDLYDEYDARIGGGLAAQNRTPVRPCEGEACLGAGTAPTAAQPRGTATFSGSGNEKPKKKKHKKPKKHKKHHKKKQGKKKSHKKQGKKSSRRNSGGNR